MVDSWIHANDGSANLNELGLVPATSLSQPLSDRSGISVLGCIYGRPAQPINLSLLLRPIINQLPETRPVSGPK
jgi:hypothetical protein